MLLILKQFLYLLVFNSCRIFELFCFLILINLHIYIERIVFSQTKKEAIDKHWSITDTEASHVVNEELLA